MFLKKKNRHKFFYKQLIKLRENIQNRKKFLNFKKRKWKKFNEINYKKFKLKDPNQYQVSQYPNRFFSYIKCYKNTLMNVKKFKLFYGNLPKKLIKKCLSRILKKNYKNRMVKFVSHFERRLDIVLYRSFFAKSIRESKQFVAHNKIFVNNKLITFSSYELKFGDIISISPTFFNYIEWNIKKCLIEEVLPKHLIINYRTLEIIFGNIKNINFFSHFLYYLNLEKIMISYYYKIFNSSEVEQLAVNQ